MREIREDICVINKLLQKVMQKFIVRQMDNGFLLIFIVDVSKYLLKLKI